MNMENYFTEHKGTGVLATADSNGRVNTAIYSRPHIFADNSLGLIMRDRLSRLNLLDNPQAAYLFREDGGGYRGVRLWLKMTGESDDPEKIAALSRRKKGEEEVVDKEAKFLVYFTVEKAFALIGGEEVPLS